MQDKNSHEELDALLADILKSKAATSFGKENNVEDILADLGLAPHTLHAPAQAPSAKDNLETPNAASDAKNAFLKDAAFADTFAPANNAFFAKEPSANAPIAKKSFKEKLLQTVPAGWDSDEDGDDSEFADVYTPAPKTPAVSAASEAAAEAKALADSKAAIAAKAAAARQAAIEAQWEQSSIATPLQEPLQERTQASVQMPTQEPLHERTQASVQMPTQEPAQGAAYAPLPKTAAPLQADKPVHPAENAQHCEPQLESDEEPTVEFVSPEEAAVHKRREKSPTFVIRPNYEEEARAALERTGTMRLSEVDETFREFFGETVAVDREELERGLRGKKAGKLFRGLFGARRAETGELTGDIDLPPIEDEEGESLDDYNTPSDALAVEATLKSMRTNCTLRVVAIALITLLLLYLGLSARTGLLPSIPVLNPANEPFLFLIINLVLLCITALVSFTTLTTGISGLFSQASADTLPCLALVGAFAQNLAFVIKPDSFEPEKITLFAPVAALLMLANAIGKRMHCTIVCRNFDTVSVGHEHAAAYLIRDRELAHHVCEGIAEPEPALLVSRPTALVRGFLRQSFSARQSDGTARIMGYIILAAAMACAVITYLSAKNVFAALSAFAAVTCFASPLASTLLSAVPSALLQRSAARVGAVVPGWSAIAALRETNVTLVNARDLFPPATVRLHGIKTFEKERIDIAILYAASIFIDSCDTLRDIFLGVIENKTDMLYKVENVVAEPGYGFTAWIEHSRVVLGNRAMMDKSGINIPSLDYEMKYTKGERCPIYLAVSGKLFGMFVVSYCADEDAMDVVQGLRKSGISLLVKSDDFNINSFLVSDVYNLPETSVKVLSGAEREALGVKTSYLPESEGVLTHIGTFASFIGGLRAAAGAASGEHMASLVQCASILLGVVLSVLLSVSGGLVGISLAAVMLFQTAWAALTILVPFAKRY